MNSLFNKPNLLSDCLPIPQYVHIVTFQYAQPALPAGFPAKEQLESNVRAT